MSGRQTRSMKGSGQKQQKVYKGICIENDLSKIDRVLFLSYISCMFVTFRAQILQHMGKAAVRYLVMSVRICSPMNCQ